MSNYIQNQFIANWNSIAKKLSGSQHYKKLPRLDNDGTCAGISFTLADYVRLEKSDRFHVLYQFICAASSRKLAKTFKLHSQCLHLLEQYKQSKSPRLQNKICKKIEKLNLARKNLFPNLTIQDMNEIIDFIFKIYILQKKQDKAQIPIEKETEFDEWLRQNANSHNHIRIGGKLSTKDVDVGEIYEPHHFENNLPQIIDNLQPNESINLGISCGDGHAIIVYKAYDHYHVFDCNTGVKFFAKTPQEAASEIIYCTNHFLTEGTHKFTAFDRFWKNSHLFKAFAILCFPVTLAWFVHDVFFVKPMSKEELSKKPLSDKLWLSWGKTTAKKMAAHHNDHQFEKIKHAAPIIRPDPMAKAITQPELTVISNRHAQIKKSRSFSFFKSHQNRIEEKIKTSIKQEPCEQQRFHLASQYVNDNPYTDLAKAIKENIPAIDAAMRKLR